jgi:hypothetical protein
MVHRHSLLYGLRDEVRLLRCALRQLIGMLVMPDHAGVLASADRRNEEILKDVVERLAVVQYLRNTPALGVGNQWFQSFCAESDPLDPFLVVLEVVGVLLDDPMGLVDVLLAYGGSEDEAFANRDLVGLHVRGESGDLTDDRDQHAAHGDRDDRDQRKANRQTASDDALWLRWPLGVLGSGDTCRMH